MKPDSGPVSGTRAVNSDASLIDGHIQTTDSSKALGGKGTTTLPPRDAAAPPSGWRNTLVSLKNRDFLLLWLGMLFMMGGMQMQMIARGYYVYEITSSPSKLAFVNAGAAIPILVLALFGGAVADRLDRRRVIQWSQATNLAIALVMGVAIATGSATWVHFLVASTVQGGVWSFLMPSRQAIIPEIVGQRNLTNAMALSAAGMSASTLVAPAIAGVLYTVIGPDGVYFVIGATGLASVALTAMMGYKGGGRAKSDAPMMNDIRAGLFYCVRSPMVLVLLAMGMTATLLAMPFRFLIPIFVVDIYSRGPEALGLMVTVMGLGSLLGAMFIASIGQWRRGLLLVLGTIMSGVGLLLVAAVPLYYAAVGFMLVLGLGDAARRTLNMSLIMEVVDDEYRGRVMSVFMMNFGLMPLGVLPAGLAIELLGGQATVAILGVLLLAVAFVVLFTQRRLVAYQ